MTTQMYIGRDVQGYPLESFPFSDIIYTATLATSGSSTVTVPGSFQNWIALITYPINQDIWMSINGTAAVPAGGAFAAQDSFLLPGWGHHMVNVKADDVIDILNADSTNTAGVSISLYTTPQIR